LSLQGREFVQKSLTTLENQIHMDQLAAKKGHISSVREFARTAVAEHKDLRNSLLSALRMVEPDFPLQETILHTRLNELDGMAFDREYLESFRKNHAVAQNAIQLLSTQEPQPIHRFIREWSAVVDRHLASADKLLMELPKVASNIAMLLVLGGCSIVCALGIYVRERLRAGY
jgi:predicted outer membrane protein